MRNDHEDAAPRRALFVAGTDTGIGKTHTACALLHAFAARGERAVGMKPVASGCLETPDGLRSEDAQALQAASVGEWPYPRINPVALRAPLSPHLAAAQDGVRIELDALRESFDWLRERADRVVVEGVGGWLAPLAADCPAAAIAQRWNLPVVLVVGMRLGCLNHALLSARAIRADGCVLAGWIANRVDPAMDAFAGNLATLDALLDAPRLGVLPHGADPRAAAAMLDLAALAA